MFDATRIAGGAAVLPASSPATRPIAQPAALATSVQAVAESPLTLNPRVFFDTEIDQLVMEFRDSDGALRSSLPSAKELAAYRWAARTGAAAPGTAPPQATNP